MTKEILISYYKYSNLFGETIMKKVLGTLSDFITLPFLWIKDRPVLYRGKNVTIVAFGIFAALDAIAVGIITIYYLYIKGYNLGLRFFVMLLVMGICAWFFAKFLHILALGKKFWSDPRKYLSETGFYVQGGIVGAILGSALTASVSGIPLFALWDAMAWGALLGQFFGRLGCFNYGCCWGKETHDHQHGTSYHNPEVKVLRMHPELNSKKLYPTQLYTAYLHLISFITVALFIPRPLPGGLIASLFLIYHGLSRILLEGLRHDIYFDHKRNWITFSMSLFTIVTGLALWFIRPIISSEFAISRDLLYSMNLKSLVEMFRMNALSWIFPLGLGIMIFSGYGIHGKILGTFPWSARNKISIKG